MSGLINCSERIALTSLIRKEMRVVIGGDVLESRVNHR